MTSLTFEDSSRNAAAVLSVGHAAKRCLSVKEAFGQLAAPDPIIQPCCTIQVMLASLYCERAKACMRLKDWRGA